jgi:hypothetical protein
MNEREGAIAWKKEEFSSPESRVVSHGPVPSGLGWKYAAPSAKWPDG